LSRFILQGEADVATIDVDRDHSVIYFAEIPRRILVQAAHLAFGCPGESLWASVQREFDVVKLQGVRHL